MVLDNGSLSVPSRLQEVSFIVYNIMNLNDEKRWWLMEYGWVMLVVLAVMGGIIAYLGDKIGSRVGKQKIKLFGLSRSTRLS